MEFGLTVDTFSDTYFAHTILNAERRSKVRSKGLRYEFLEQTLTFVPVAV